MLRGLRITGQSRRGWAPAPRNGALDIFRERYARGEISREEYESRRRDLAA